MTPHNNVPRKGTSTVKSPAPDDAKVTAGQASGSHHKPSVNSSLPEKPNLQYVRVRNLEWWIDWTPEGGYTAKWKHGSYGVLKAATEEDLELKIRSAPVGKPQAPEAHPNEMSPVKAKYPRFWIQRVHEGYLALPRGTYPLLAPTIEELDQKLQLST